MENRKSMKLSYEEVTSNLKKSKDDTGKIMESQKNIMTISSKELRSELDQCHRQTEEKETATKDLNARNNDMKSSNKAMTSKLDKCEDYIGSKDTAVRILTAQRKDMKASNADRRSELKIIHAYAEKKAICCGNFEGAQ